MKSSLKALFVAAAMLTAQFGVATNTHAQVTLSATADTTVYSNNVIFNGPSP